jgi:hypothetical protein
MTNQVNVYTPLTTTFYQIVPSKPDNTIQLLSLTGPPA